MEVRLALASVGSLFDVLGVPPLLGRTFTEADDTPDGERLVVLSYGAWQRRFGGSEDIIGSDISLSGLPHTVIGVMPAAFQFPGSGQEFWRTARFSQEFRANTYEYFLQVVARLRPEQTVAAATAEMEPLMAGLREIYPDENDNVRVEIVPLHEQLVTGVQTRIWVLMAAVGFVLLIACVNLANLLLSRASARVSEIAVRQSLGASRLRVARQLITESLLLSAFGAVAGVAVGLGFLRLLLTLTAGNIPRTQNVGIDVTVLGFTLLISMLAGLAFGLFPALQIARSNPAHVLRESSRGTIGRRWMRDALVVAEIALALVLLTGAGLLIRSFDLLQQVDPGVPTERILTFGVSLPGSAYPEPENVVTFYEDAVERLGNLPGVDAAAVITSLPTTGWGNGAWFNIIDEPVAPGEKPPSVRYRVISPGYLDKMGYTLVRGRWLSTDDRPDSMAAAVINQTLAEQYWPESDPLGKQVMLGPLDAAVFPTMTVVGIVEDVQTLGLAATTTPVLYFPHALMPSFNSFNFTIRSAVEPTSLIGLVRAELRDMDPQLPLTNIRTMEEVVESTLSTQRSSMILLAVFAGVAMAMAAVGVFGVLSHTVTQRSREFGIRMALGADAGKLRRLVVRQGLAQALIGLSIGLVGAFALTRCVF